MLLDLLDSAGARDPWVWLHLATTVAADSKSASLSIGAQVVTPMDCLQRVEELCNLNGNTKLYSLARVG